MPSTDNTKVAIDIAHLRFWTPIQCGEQSDKTDFTINTVTVNEMRGRATRNFHITGTQAQATTTQNRHVRYREAQR